MCDHIIPSAAAPAVACDHISPRAPTRTATLRPHLIFDQREPGREGGLAASLCGAVRAAVGRAGKTPPSRRVRGAPGHKGKDAGSVPGSR